MHVVRELWRMPRRTRWALAVVAGLVAAVVVPGALHPADATPGCGAQDKPETGIAGDVPLVDQLSGRADEGYNCGVAVVGYSSLGGRGGNANMAWSGDCAYVTGNGIAVLDVHDPAHPRQVTTLYGPGSSAAVETIHAMDAPDRHVLVAGRYGLFGFKGEGGTGPIDIYDTTDCTHPKLLSTIELPDNVHNLTLTADARRVYSTLPLQAADLTDLRHPKFLGNLEDDLQADGVSHLEYAHEAWPSPDGTRLYIGGQIVGDEELIVMDIHDWPHRRATVVGRTPLPGHSIRPATIGGKPFLINSDESVVSPTAKGCVPDLTPVGGPSQPYLTDISDERAPHAVSQFRLPINEPQNCLREIASGVNASVHYQDVDDAADTHFAMLSMWNAGMRIVDVRDPYHQREVAYFNPGRFSVPNGFAGVGVDPALEFEDPGQLDQAWGHIRYVPSTGDLWLATRSGGFWVLELEPQVRAALGLPARPTAHPQGTSPRPAASYVTVNPLAGSTALYCTLNAVGASVHAVLGGLPLG
jgi:hypothetical protein